MILLNKRKSFVILALDRLFDFSGFILGFYFWFLLANQTNLFSELNYLYTQKQTATGFFAILFLLFFHFLFGAKWLQQVHYSKVAKSGFFYFSRRLGFILSFIYVLLSFLSLNPLVWQFIDSYFQVKILLDVLFVCFVYYLSTCVSSFLVQSGFIIRKKNILFSRILFVGLPFSIAVFYCVLTYKEFLMGYLP